MDEKLENDLEEIEEEKAPTLENIKASKEYEDTDDLVVPDKNIFSKVFDGEVVTKSNSEKGFIATWHGEDEDREQFEVDESFTSSATADKSFMKAFGLSETGTHRTMTDIDKPKIKYEYTDDSQNNEIRESYKRAKKVNTINIIVAVIFASILFLQENVFEFINIGRFHYLDMSTHPYIHIVVSLVSLFACAICAREQIIQGTRSILKKAYSPDSIVPIALLAGVLHTLITLVFVAISYGTHVVLLNFPVAAILVISLLYFRFNIKRERYGFAVVSYSRPKFVLEKVEEINAESEYDTFTTTITNGEEYVGQIARTVKTPFVKNYSQNTDSVVDVRKYLKLYYIFALSIPLVFAIISVFLDKTDKNIYASFTYYFVGLFSVIPVGILFSYSVPFLIANTRLYENDKVSIIGEEAIESYADIDALVVEDTAAFPYKNVKVSPIKLYNGYKFEDVIYYSASGFSKVGGPLSRVFNNMLGGSVAKSARVNFVCAGRNYLRVTVDGHSIIFADKNGMTIQNIEVGFEKEENKNLSIMYVACDGVLCSKMYIEYKINEEFLQTTKYVNSKKMVVGVRSFDPNINNDLINRVTGFTKKQVKVIKLTSISDVYSTTQRRDGQIVSKGSSCALLRAIPMCRSILKTRKVIKAVKIIASIVGLAYLGVCIFAPIKFGPLNIFPSGSIVLLYTIFAFIMYILTCIILPKKK
ncbi:MAG: hypothetical protein E7602_07200 [Ruminococcaceae bacterium]|nr:hypothetical protein [Oscillospiraceae bacterium]